MVTDGIIKLPTEFTGKGAMRGYKFVQEMRSGRVAMYRLESDIDSYYEVIIIQKNNKGFDSATKKWVNSDLRETYPSANQFGVCGWSFSDRFKAEVKFGEIVSKLKSEDYL